MKAITAITLIIVTITFSGCGEQRPAGLPKLYPCTVTITQEGVPLADASVTLEAADAALAKWTVGGRTDERGVCRVKTQGRYDGAPAGTFNVGVYKSVHQESETAKQPPPADEKALEIYHEKIRQEEKFFECVDEKYKQPETSGLLLEITADKNAQTFDVGKAVKVPVKLIN